MRTRTTHMDDMKERWRQVLGFEGFYEVSNMGRVRSVCRLVNCLKGERVIEGRILKQRLGSSGYLSVMLSKGEAGETKTPVHRLVAIAFIAEGGSIVRHLDGCATNNHASNLAWGTHADNEADKLRHGRRPMGEAHPNSKMTDGHVRKIRELSARGFSQLAIAKALGLNRGVVGYVVRGQAWNHVR